MNIMNLIDGGLSEIKLDYDFLSHSLKAIKYTNSIDPLVRCLCQNSGIHPQYSPEMEGVDLATQ